MGAPDNTRTYEALAKAIFSRGDVETFLSPHADELYVRVLYTFDARELRQALREGDRYLVDAFIERIGGTPMGSQFRRHVEHVAAQRDRRFSLRAARRHGRHKVLGPSPGVVAP